MAGQPSPGAWQWEHTSAWAAHHLSVKNRKCSP